MHQLGQRATLPGECAVAPNVRRLSAALDIPAAPLWVRNAIDTWFNEPGQISLLRNVASPPLADVGPTDRFIPSLWNV